MTVVRGKGAEWPNERGQAQVGPTGICCQLNLVHHSSPEALRYGGALDLKERGGRGGARKGNVWNAFGLTADVAPLFRLTLWSPSPLTDR
jgi:hypothetical protein